MRTSTTSVTVAIISMCPIAVSYYTLVIPRHGVVHNRATTAMDGTSCVRPAAAACAFAATTTTTRIHYKNGGYDEDEYYAQQGDDFGMSFLSELKDRNDRYIEKKRTSIANAMRDATRRTYPADAMRNRLEEGRIDRESREMDRLERAYAELLMGGGKMGEGDGNDADDGASSSAASDQFHPTTETTTKTTKMIHRADEGVIPILDVLSRPLLYERPPLLVGGTLTLTCADLTPSQRGALDVAIAIRRGEEEDDGDSSTAPIIAIVDGYTARGRGNADKRGRYATLASIETIEGGGVGSGGGDGGGYDDVDRRPCAIRLVGIGRAVLRDHFLSSDGRRRTEEDEALSIILARMREFDDGRAGRYREEDEEDDVEDHGADDDDYVHDNRLPVIMADFDVYLDDNTLLSSEGGGSSSSVHAIAELYRAANRVYRLHEERKRLVAGLRAGAARLRSSRERMARIIAEFEDCDGLGCVGWASFDDAANGPGTMPSADAAATPWGGIINDIPMRRELEAMENFGLGSYGILSTIPELTRELISQLEPYYSPVHREREEYEAEVASMAVLRTLEEYATPDELAAGLLAPSATHRLELGFEVMMRHKEKLHELVRIISDELIDCGEECTDLW